MGLTRYKLGELTKASSATNRDLKYDVDMIRGVSSEGKFISPNRETTELSLYRYKIVNNGAFVYNGTTLSLGAIAYRTEGLCIVSHLCVVFYLNEKGEKLLDPYYLFMYFRRKEFYRQIAFRNFGSQRAEFTFREFSDIVIPVPPIDIQRKYVRIYLAMTENQRAYERGFEDLRIVCDGYIEDLRRKMPCEKIGAYIRPVDERNTNLEIKLAQGITTEKEFASPRQVAATETNAKIVRTGQFAYNRATTRNGEKISIAYRNGEDCVVSSAYQVFEISEKDKLLPEYLMMWFKRSEFDRYARFMSQGSAHEFFEYSDMCNVSIPIPSIEIQRSIADIYNICQTRKSISERLKAQIKNICPVLIKGSLEEAQKE